MIKEETPDCWIVFKIQTDRFTMYKLLVGWAEAMAHGMKWNISAKIVNVEDTPDVLKVTCANGILHNCYKTSYGLSTNMVLSSRNVPNITSDTVTLMPADTDWKSIKW